MLAGCSVFGCMGATSAKRGKESPVSMPHSILLRKAETAKAMASTNPVNRQDDTKMMPVMKTTKMLVMMGCQPHCPERKGT